MTIFLETDFCLFDSLLHLSVLAYGNYLGNNDEERVRAGGPEGRTGDKTLTLNAAYP